jgi:hypothetical protein
MHYLAEVKPWIIGYIPTWIDSQKVRCLPWPDPYRKCKDANLLHKAIRLAMEQQISDPFILCSDDHLLLRPSTPLDFKLWHGGEIPMHFMEGQSSWQQRLVNTGQRLRSAGYPAMNYDSHIPFPLRKEWVKEVLRFDFSVKPGMCIFSTILNCSKELGEPLNSQSVRGWLGKQNITESAVDIKLAKNQFASLNNESVNNSYIISRVEHLFCEPAPWELDAATWPQLNKETTICQGV